MGPEKSKKSCPICNRAGCLDEKHDAYYCLECNMWLEPKCGNKHCDFCGTRPMFPKVKNQLEERLRFLESIKGKKKNKKCDTITEKKNPT